MALLVPFHEALMLESSNPNDACHRFQRLFVKKMRCEPITAFNDAANLIHVLRFCREHPVHCPTCQIWQQKHLQATDLLEDLILTQKKLAQISEKSQKFFREHPEIDFALIQQAVNRRLNSPTRQLVDQLLAD